MRVNFVFQDDRGRYSDKLAKVELIDTEQRKLVKDALDILKKRQVPSRTWGVESVRVRCSINKSDLHNNDGPTFELFEDDFLHCTICPNGDDYIVVTQQENSHVAIPKKQEPSASNTRQDCSIQNGGKVISKIWHADQIEPIGEPPKEGSVHSVHHLLSIFLKFGRSVYRENLQYTNLFISYFVVLSIVFIILV